MVYRKQTTWGLEGWNSCPGASGWNPRKRKLRMTFLLSWWSLSTQATTLLTPSSSSAYSSSETKARLLPSASWLAVTLTYSLSCHSTASQLVRTPPRPAAEKQIFTAVSWSLSRAAWVPSPVVDSSPSLTGSEGYPKNPAQVPSGNSQLARAASNPL